MGLGIDNIELDGLTSDPTTLVDGMIWFRSDLNEFRQRVNGGNVILGGKKWAPTAITLGDLTLGTGTTVGNNIGSGNYVNFDSASDDTVRVNVSLERNGLQYDGSNIDVELYWMKYGPTGGTVKWELDYTFIELGDDAYSKADGTFVETIDVTSLVDQTITSTKFPLISGNAGAKILQLTLRRNSTGPGSDTYTGSAELYATNLEV